MLRFFQRRTLSFFIKRTPIVRQAFKDVFYNEDCVKSFLSAVYGGRTIKSVEYLNAEPSDLTSKRQARLNIRVVEQSGNSYLVGLQKVSTTHEINRRGANAKAGKHSACTENTLLREHTTIDRMLFVCGQLSVKDTETLNAMIPNDQILSHINMTSRGKGTRCDTIPWTFIRLDLGNEFLINNVSAPGLSAACASWVKLLSLQKGDVIDEAEATDSGLRRACEILSTPLESLTAAQRAEYSFNESAEEALLTRLDDMVASRVMEVADKLVKNKRCAGGAIPSAQELMELYGLEADEAAAVLAGVVTVL